MFSHNYMLTMEEFINQVLTEFIMALDKRLAQDLNISVLATVRHPAERRRPHFLREIRRLDSFRQDRPEVPQYNHVCCLHGQVRIGLASLIKNVFGLIQAHGVKSLRDFRAMCTYKANMCIKSGKEGRFHFFSKLEEACKGQGSPMPYGKQVAEAGIVLNAGSDTTASGLTNTVVLLAKHSLALRKLRRELEGAWLRTRTHQNLTRATICGRFIPGGVTVSAPILKLNRNPNLFSNPDEFHPDRWFDKKQLPNLMKCVQPFSIGGRGCVGRNLAMIELTKVVATVVNRYELQLLQDELPFMARFNMNPGEGGEGMRVIDSLIHLPL
ncbi:uncharacterized protein N7498_003082 [Penicillium cinerascens]|uniref:Cytochrome P450 n=1 Tax=Penicillium cinerascens TaxID=70096 RepID=A0A9W9N1J4_9EURO|nr:uncharacterized protein N7498_003082 [Penicillium cinerascens]KAJ5211436.1 hypothetical protein N7498_003082 [Penicillium cinerascens]